MPSTIKVFILEDDPNRIQAFRDRFNSPDIPEGVTCIFSITDSVEEAKRLLSEVVFDFVLLDHDLAEITENTGLILQVKMKEETGYNLACWLEQNPEIAHRHGKYFCHSINKPGRDRIIAALKTINIKCADVPWLWGENIFWKYITIPLERRNL